MQEKTTTQHKGNDIRMNGWKKRESGEWKYKKKSMKRKFCLTFSTTHILHCSIDVPPHYRLETCNLCTIENCTQYFLFNALALMIIFSLSKRNNEGIGEKSFSLRQRKKNVLIVKYILHFLEDKLMKLTHNRAQRTTFYFPCF
jgi:hypothetical protein